MKKERAPALTEGLRIIEKAIASEEAITFESILTGIEMSRSSASRLLKVLVDSGYLVAREGHLGGYIPRHPAVFTASSFRPGLGFTI